MYSTRPSSSPESRGELVVVGVEELRSDRVLVGQDRAEAQRQDGRVGDGRVEDFLMRLEVFWRPQRLGYVHLADQGGQVSVAYQPDLAGRVPDAMDPSSSAPRLRARSRTRTSQSAGQHRGWIALPVALLTYQSSSGGPGVSAAAPPHHHLVVAADVAHEISDLLPGAFQRALGLAAGAALLQIAYQFRQAFLVL